jgi:hypothetical protein
MFSLVQTVACTVPENGEEAHGCCCRSSLKVTGERSAGQPVNLAIGLVQQFKKYYTNYSYYSQSLVIWCGF